MRIHRLARVLQLGIQLCSVNYDKKHFVHADYSRERILRELRTHRQTEKSNKQHSKDIKAANRRLSRIMNRVIRSRGRLSLNQKRHIVARSFFTGSNDQIEAFTTSPMLKDRNIHTLKVLNREISKKEYTKIAIFYGAFHLPDFKERLTKDGFEYQSSEWIDAWTFDVPICYLNSVSKNVLEYAKNDQKAIFAGLKKFKQTHGRFPSEVEGLEALKLKYTFNIRDAWGRPYVYYLKEERPVVKSLGIDGREGGSFSKDIDLSCRLEHANY